MTLLSESELREKLRNIVVKSIHPYKPYGDVARLDPDTVNDAIEGMMQLITQYGDTQEREGRIDELTNLFPSYERDGIGINYTVYNEWVRKRVAELKEEV